MRREHPMANRARVQPGITLAELRRPSRLRMPAHVRAWGLPPGAATATNGGRAQSDDLPGPGPGGAPDKTPAREEARAFCIQPRDDFSRLFQPTHVSVADSEKSVRRWRAEKVLRNRAGRRQAARE